MVVLVAFDEEEHKPNFDVIVLQMKRVIVAQRNRRTVGTEEQRNCSTEEQDNSRHRGTEEQ